MSDTTPNDAPCGDCGCRYGDHYTTNDGGYTSCADCTGCSGFESDVLTGGME